LPADRCADRVTGGAGLTVGLILATAIGDLWFVWTATTDEILAKVLITQTNIKKLVANNTK
jgi:hypothetical protein